MADGKDTNNTGVGNATDGNGGNNMNTDNTASTGGGGGQKGSASKSKPKLPDDKDLKYRQILASNTTYGDSPLNWYKSISSAFGMDTIKRMKTKNSDPDIEASNMKAKADGINNVADLSYTITQSLMQAVGKAVDKAIAGAIAKGDGRYKKK